MIIVCAAANAGKLYKYNISYPGRLGSVLCVGSHTANGQPSAFTSVGREVDFLAPGEDIWSTAPGGQYVLKTGTSMAAPFVSGLAALILAYDRSFRSEIRNVAQVRELFRAMCSKSGHHDQESGHGTLDPKRIFSNPTYFYDTLKEH